MDIKGTLAYINGIKNGGHREYATRLFCYYRDYGKAQPSPWPHQQAASLPNATVTRINNTVRHYMVGDCDINGNALSR